MFGAAQRTRLDERALIVRRPHKSIDQFRIRHSPPPVPRQLHLVLRPGHGLGFASWVRAIGADRKSAGIGHRTRPFYLISRARFSISAGNVNRRKLPDPLQARQMNSSSTGGSQTWRTRDQLGPYAFVHSETMTPMMLGDRRGSPQFYWYPYIASCRRQPCRARRLLASVHP
jgi:hypothetical protein